MLTLNYPRFLSHVWLLEYWVVKVLHRSRYVTQKSDYVAAKVE